MTVLVLRTGEMEKTKQFFTDLGLDFVEEKHGNGPVHFACERNGVVFEIYPQGKDGQDSVKFLDGY